jgi:prefoldin subunit 5
LTLAKGARGVAASTMSSAEAEDTLVEANNSQARLEEEANAASISLESLTEGQNERDIPAVRFLDDIGAFADQFTPPASPELLIGAYSDIFSKFKAYETTLSQRSEFIVTSSFSSMSLFDLAKHFSLVALAGLNFQQKIPEIEKSLAIVKNLKKKQEENEALVARYSLADDVYGKAEIDTSAGIVGLWLGANVMLEYTYDDAIALLIEKEEKAKRDYEEVTQDLSFTRNQIVTAEVNISRIYNWDVRRKRIASGDNAVK